MKKKLFEFLNFIFYHVKYVFSDLMQFLKSFDIF